MFEKSFQLLVIIIPPQTIETTFSLPRRSSLSGCDFYIVLVHAAVKIKALGVAMDVDDGRCGGW